METVRNSKYILDRT